MRDDLRHFAKVSKSYWPGLFRCDESSELPRTNNDLEHLFGSHRYHERRASGRRRDPDAYLAQLESNCLKLSLPA
ncbi:MAG: hypothetical protein JO114_13125 [Planctomycetaceae bacterium]|nr:hypothetical protein [Planctomycetaceae bacterium]